MILMLIISVVAHLLHLRPAALIGFPVMIIGATALILVLLYLVGPEQQREGTDPAIAAGCALMPAVAVDPQTGRILAANSQAADLFEPEIVSVGSHFGDLFSGGTPDDCRNIIRDVVTHGEAEVQGCSMRTASGGPSAFRLRACMCGAGSASFVLVGLVDNDLNDAVAEFGRIQERLMSNISHELRTPLNVVMGFSELLTTGTLGKMPDNQLDAAEECHEGGERMLRLINDILDVGRSRSYYLKAETGPLSTREMVSRVENLLSGQARREELRLEVDLDETLPVIESEERAFKQLVYHLILNSMKRSDPGDTIKIAAQRDEDHLVLSVTDSGGAVTEDIQPQPTAPVAENAAETLAPPLLGLPLCATLAERLGATLSTDHDQDGMHFVVRMPLLRS